MDNAKLKELQTIAENKVVDSLRPALHGDHGNFYQEEYYHLLTEEQIDFLDSLDGFYELVDVLRVNPDQYVFISLYGEPIDFGELRKMKEIGWGSEESFATHCATLDSVSEILKTFKDHELTGELFFPLRWLDDHVIYACLMDKNK